MINLLVSRKYSSSEQIKIAKHDNGVGMLGSKTEPGFNVESKLRKLMRQQDLRGIHLPALPGSG
jgi:hypothetical protein